MAYCGTTTALAPAQQVSTLWSMLFPAIILLGVLALITIIAVLLHRKQQKKEREELPKPFGARKKK